MKVHELKTINPYFNEVWSGNKTFECRLNDRDFKEGDPVLLREYSDAHGYSGRTISGEIGFVLRDFQGTASGYVVFSIRKKKRNGIKNR